MLTLLAIILKVHTEVDASNDFLETERNAKAGWGKIYEVLIVQKICDG